jgi:hypothetical protein
VGYGEVLADAWPECAQAVRVVVKVRWIDPGRTECLHRDVFADAFIHFSAGTWTIARDASLSFRAKYSGQLPRQCVVRASSGPDGLAPQEPTAFDMHNWRVVPSPLKRARFVDVPLTSADPLALHVAGRWAPERAEDVGAHLRDVVFRGRQAEGMLFGETYDLGAIALHRFELDAKGSACALVYSEVPRFDDNWRTRSRSKVSLVDAVAGDAPNAALFGVRGCRYVHVLSASEERPVLRAQRREYPLTWRTVNVEPGLERVVDACRANLVACVDGGIVDTCWRERAQWTGDLRMSSIALRALCDNAEVTENALHQVAQSYDAARAMVKGVSPVHNSTHDLFIPQFHLAFCHAVLEHRARAGASVPRDLVDVVRATTVQWRSQLRHVRDGLVQHIPGWSFTDWDPEDERHEGKNTPEAPNAVVNAWWLDLCARLDVPSGVTAEAFDAAFKRDVGYGLFANDGRSSIHASAVAATCGAGDSDHALAHLDAAHARGDISRRVTPYFAYFVALAFAERSREDALRFARDHYGPIAQRWGTIVERTNSDYSLAHGWSVAIAALSLRP